MFIARAFRGRRGQHPLQHLRAVRGVAIFAVFGQQLGGLLTVVAGPDLRFNNGIHDFLRPLRAVIQVMLMHKHHAAGVIAPHVPGKALHSPNLEVFRQGIERLGNDVASDALGGQCWRHV